MDYSGPPEMIILGIDGLEYNLVENWRLKNITQEAYRKLDLSDYKVVVTPPIWGSMLTGEIDKEIIEIWVKHAEILGGGVNVKQKWWAKLGRPLPPTLNFWIWDHFFEPLIGGDPFEKTANYVIEKNVPNIFQFFEKPWTNGIPGYGKNACNPVQKRLTEQAITGERKPYRKYILNYYKKDKAQLVDVLNKQEHDIIFWYTQLLDVIGHMDMGKPVKLMMKHYLEINKLIGEVKARCPSSVVYVISDHGMERMDLKSGSWGEHSDHAFFSSNTGETIDKPFQLYDLVLKHKNIEKNKMNSGKK